MRQGRTKTQPQIKDKPDVVPEERRKKLMDWKPDDLHALITIPANDCNYKGSLVRATDAELVDAKTYLTRHPESNKSRLTAVNREIRRRARKGGKKLMDELKPCPFCGGEAAVYGVDSYYVACCRCEAQTARYKTAQEAIVNWNRRAAPENKPLTCEGCKREGERDCWCRRAPKFRALPDDHYEPRRPEDAPEGSKS